MDDLGNKRPDCQMCGREESAQMIINGQLMCGGCIMKYREFQDKKAKKELESFKNAVC